MSMEYRTILEMIQVFCAYMFCVYCIPSIVCHNLLRGKTFSTRFLLCILIGNFYIINIVFLIFLLHIPGKLTLYLFTAIPLTAAWIKINHPQIKRFFLLLATAFSRLFLGEAKIKTIFSLLFYQPKKQFKHIFFNLISHIRRHFIEWIMLLGCFVFNIWYYGYQTVTTYVYGASDMSVHHEWINQMDEGVIFYNGIYPFGFHNVIYFLHNIFGLSILSILRVFSIVIMIFIYIMLYLLLRKVCRSRYMPIFGVFLFTLPHIFNFQGTMRYQWTLPQEFAMVFLYPCAYFLIQFFEQKKKELDKEKELKNKKKLYAWIPQYFIRPSTKSLILCGISFSLTLAIHFYITIIAVFLLLAIFLAYFPISFHYRYLLPITAAAILSLFTAALPMGIGYLQGTDIEGSLRWALSAMSSGEETDNGEETEAEDTKETESRLSADKKTESSENTMKNASSDATSASLGQETDILTKIASQLSQTGRLLQRNFCHAIQWLIANIKKINEKTEKVLYNVYDMQEIIQPLLVSLEIMLLLSCILVAFRRFFYYRNFLGICIYMAFMILLMCAPEFSLPSVMDNARARLFLTYATPLYAACLADFFYAIFCKPFHYHRMTELLPIGLTALICYLTIANNLVKPLNIVYALQLPGEMKCNYQIMEEYPDNSWTLVTTTNSYALVRQKGYLYELCDFLEEMENYTTDTEITIPTKYVFFYIEKEPVDYGSFNLVTEPINTIDYVSEEAAAMDVDYSSGNIYSMNNRYILESKFFYWAKAFEEEYPSEFQVYYEDEQFICYRIIQNEYNLYNFSIDYQYNN